jgi:hypothetical protein
MYNTKNANKIPFMEGSFGFSVADVETSKSAIKQRKDARCLVRNAFVHSQI